MEPRTVPRTHHYRTTSLTPLTHNREIWTAAPLNPTDHAIVRSRQGGVSAIARGTSAVLTLRNKAHGLDWLS